MAGTGDANAAGGRECRRCGGMRDGAERDGHKDQQSSTHAPAIITNARSTMRVVEHAAQMTFEEFRSRFPIFNRRVYVNSCSQGALSIDVEQAVRGYLDSWHEQGSPWEMWVDQVERLRRAFPRRLARGGVESAAFRAPPPASTPFPTRPAST